MQFPRTLDRRREILDGGFELIECWEHVFKERPLYPKKEKRNFSACHSVRYRGVAGHEQMQAGKEGSVVLRRARTGVCFVGRQIG